MRKGLITSVVAAAGLVGMNLPVAAADRSITAPIRKVTVYMDQARITREATVKLEPGDQVLLIEQISGGALETSFRASASGVKGITILGLSHRQIQHLQPVQDKVAELQGRIRKIEHQEKKVVTDRLAALTEQRNMIIGVSRNAGDQLARQFGQQTLSISKWEEADRYIGKRITELDDTIRVLQGRLEEIDNVLSQLGAELDECRNPQTKTSRTVQIDLRLDRAGEAMVSLEYIVPGASWRPLYDARLVGDSGRVEFTYAAEVSQHTGEDWKEVDLTLSTAAPSRGTGPGEFMPRYLSEFSPNMLPLDGPDLRVYKPEVSYSQVSGSGHKGVIRGRIVDQQTSLPLPGVTVILKGTNIGALTDYEGKYRIPNVDPGEYTLVVSSVGYSTVEATDIGVRGDFLTEFNQSLPTKAVSGKEIIVSGKRDVIEKTIAGSLISRDAAKIRAQPVQNVENLLRVMGGVQTTSSGEVFIRGERAGEVAYIVDGVPIADPFGGAGQTGANLSLVAGSILGGGSDYGPWNQKPAEPVSTVAEVSNAMISQGAYTSNFTTRRKETIPSGDQVVRTTVAQWRLEGSLRVVSRPRNIDGAYRLVSIKNQGEAPLLPGKVAIFVESDYLGGAQLTEMIAPNQTFDLPFGQDNTLTVTRRVWTLKKSESGDRTKLEYTVRITTTNHGTSSRMVQIEEAFPVSRDDRVKTRLGDITPAVTTVDATGKGLWSLSVGPGDSTVVAIPLRLEYPRGLTLVER